MVWEKGAAKVLVAERLGKDVMNKVLASTWLGEEAIKKMFNEHGDRYRGNIVKLRSG
jgi:hypothetical protein